MSERKGSLAEMTLILAVAYIFGALAVLVFAIPLGIYFGLYEDSYMSMVAKSMLIYVWALVGITLGLAAAIELYNL